MKQTTAIIIVAFAGMIAISAISIRASLTADYWRKQYDQEKAARIECTHNDYKNNSQGLHGPWERYAAPTPDPYAPYQKPR